jgi:hypothetical protein
MDMMLKNGVADNRFQAFVHSCHLSWQAYSCAATTRIG